MSQVVAALVSVGAVLAFCGLVWYKVKRAGMDGVVQKQIEDQAAAKVSLEKQVAAKNESERQELDVQIATIRAANDTRAALDLLAKLRGTH